MDNDFFKEHKDIFKKNIIKLTGETKQNKISSLLNVSESKISRWFAGSLAPTLDDLLIISEKYDCSIDWLIGKDHRSSNGLSVYNICKTLVEIDTEIGFSQKAVPCERKYVSEIDFDFFGPEADDFGNIQVEYQSIYFPDIIFKTDCLEYSYAGKEINAFLQKYAGLKKAYQQELIDDNILQDAINSLLKKLSHEKIVFK